jgi:diguanylate cyclase (GGDEF)-like protein/putative nucleotidyltransferase with HDIG domain
MFFCGTSGFLQKKVSRRWLYIFAVSFLIVIPIRLSGIALSKAAVPLSLTCSCMFFWLAVLVAKTEKINVYERIILGVAFALWGIAIVLYPAYYIWNTLPVTIGYLIIGCAALIAAMTLQGVYFRHLHTSLLQKDVKIKQYGMYDKLTGLLNRAYFEEELAALDVVENLPISVIIGDVNGLKLINDTFGHAKGDELLLDTVSIIHSSCRESDRIARWGGDEFAVLMIKTSYEDAMIIVDAINQKSKNFKPKTIPVHISFGVAEKTGVNTPIDDVLKMADDRMYDEKLLKSGSTRRTIIDFLQNILWEKDYQTEKHVMRLKEMVADMGNFLSLTSKEIEELCLAAVLHDIGKIAVPEEILKKPDKLTENEWVIMKRHTDTGYRIAQSCGELAHISQYIMSHHEWWNGCGYPHGLKGEEIPFYSRIIAIADAYDVMIHDRPYQAAKSSLEALSEIKQQAGTQFDPYLVKVFLPHL